MNPNNGQFHYSISQKDVRLSNVPVFKWLALSHDFYSNSSVDWMSSIQIVSEQLGSKMDFEWSKRGWVANGLDFECDLKSGSPTI